MSRKSGFTLIELLIVMVVIGILVAIAIPSFRGMQNEAKKAKAQGDLRVLKLAAEAYYARNNTVPASLNVLTNEGTVLQVLPKDPFTAAGQYTYKTAPAGTPTYYAITSVGTNAADNTTLGDTGIVTSASDDIGVTNGTPPSGNSNWQ